MRPTANGDRDGDAVRWPRSFWWGTGASSTQCEGAAPCSDWLAWEQAGHAPISGDGNGFAHRYEEDFALLADLGLTHHRLSIEWARIEPEQGVRDEAEVLRYRRILEAAADARVTPWVCLHHFTLPAWFTAMGGFVVPENRTNFWLRHVEHIASELGDLVGGWKPVNETNYYARNAYRGGGWPPGENDRAKMRAADVGIHLATAEAAALLRQTGAPVASIFGLSPAVAQDDDEATIEAVRRFYEVMWDPGIGLFRDGVLRLPGSDPIERPDLAGCFDVFGFSYYSAVGFAHGRPSLHPVDAPQSPLGYGIWAGGLGLVLDRLHDLLPDTPLLVDEYGIGTDDDDERARYLVDGLSEVRSALERGIDVRGFFHWTAVDNYEWLHGYDVRFGLFDRDRNMRPSASVLAAATGADGATGATGATDR